jgi:hypothetical protein
MGRLRRVVDGFRQRYLWVKARGATQRGDPDGAIELFGRMQAVAPLRAYHVAYLGMVHLIKGDRDEAKRALQSAASATANKSSAGGKYINLYARTVLAVMDGNDAADPLLEEALSLDCDPRLKRWLPLGEWT